VARFRAEVARCGAWREAVDGLRADTQRLWQALPLAERRRLLRHVRPWWEVHRHRMAPAVGERVARLVEDGRLRVFAGHIAGGTGGHLFVRRRGGGRLSLPADRVVDCTGPETDCRRMRDPLLRSLLDAGHARPDPLHLGLDTTPDGALAGAPPDTLFALGPLTRPALWEITAVPDIRDQAAALAARLA
jgi:uncharacterized NAD(P)/FAD-binding protein YdhS